MIGDEIPDIASGLHPEFVIDSGAVDIFRQRSRIVVGDDIGAVVDEFRFLLRADEAPVYSSFLMPGVHLYREGIFPSCFSKIQSFGMTLLFHHFAPDTIHNSRFF